MATIESNQPSVQGLQDKENFTDEKTGQKIHKHLEDEDDVISDEDIKNIRTDITGGNTAAAVQNESEEMPNDEGGATDKEADNKKSEEKEPTPIITPWNILD